MHLVDVNKKKYYIARGILNLERALCVSQAGRQAGRQSQIWAFILLISQNLNLARDR